MEKENLAETVAQWVIDAHDMEQRGLHTLDSLISTTTDDGLRAALERHRIETQRHVDRLGQRLDELGKSPSALQETKGLFAAAVEAFTDEVRDEPTRHNIRDLYGAEHAEIATYQLLERLAERVGDDATARLAHENRLDEESMTRVIESNWEAILDLSVADVDVS